MNLKAEKVSVQTLKWVMSTFAREGKYFIQSVNLFILFSIPKLLHKQFEKILHFKEILKLFSAGWKN